MKAAVYRKYGVPEVVSIETLTIPQIKPDEILIKVHYTTVNRTNTGFRSAIYVISRLFSGLLRPKIKTLGCEFAGEVALAGSHRSDFKIGDKAFEFDDHQFGCHVQYKVAGKKTIFAPLPRGFDYKEAVALTEGSQYARLTVFALRN